MQIIFYLALVFGLMSWLEVESGELLPEIKHLEVGETQYIEAGRGHYGFTREDDGVFKTVSVNKDKVTVWLPDCTTIIRTWSGLNGVDRKAVKEARRTISNALNDFESVRGEKPGDSFMEIYKSSNGPNEKQLIKNTNKHGANLYQQGHGDIIQYSDREISLVGEKLDPELSRVIILKKTLGYVYRDGFVIMKPRWCQFNDDQDLLQDLGMKY